MYKFYPNACDMYWLIKMFLSPAYLPFSIAIGLILALLVVEVVLLLLGGSLFADTDGSADLDPQIVQLQASFDIETDTQPNLGKLIAASNALEELGDGDLPVPTGGFAGLLGLHHTAFMVWFVALLLGFGLSGMAIQGLAQSVLSVTLPVFAAIAFGLAAGLAFARSFARRIGAWLPKVETTATSVQFMGGLRGVVTQGTARAGVPAEVKLRDRHGNLHFLRCEPLSPGEVIPEGTEVLTLRRRMGIDRWELRILATA